VAAAMRCSPGYEVIRKTWKDQHVSPPPAQPARSTTQRMADPEWADRQPSADHEFDPRRSLPVGKRLWDSRSDAQGAAEPDQAPPQTVKSIGQNRKQPFACCKGVMGSLR